MKGVVFTEFLEWVEGRWGPEGADRIITRAGLPHSGGYTAVGTYDHQEFVRLVNQLGNLAVLPAREVLLAFGRHLFGRFVQGYPAFFTDVESAFDFLPRIDSHIHVEVRKLYADAELPRFEHAWLDPDTLALVYRSERPLGDFAEGLLQACIEHFGEALELARQDLPCSQGAAVSFLLTRTVPHERISAARAAT